MIMTYFWVLGNMKKAFDVLTEEMDKKGDANLVKVGHFEQTYQEASDE